MPEVLGQGRLSATIRPVRSRLQAAIRTGRIRWAREESKPSAASVFIPGEFIGNTAARSVIADAADSFAVELILERDGEPFWEGPITGFSETNGDVVVNAFDHLVYVEYTPSDGLALAGDAATITGTALRKAFPGDTHVWVSALPCGKESTIKAVSPREAFLLKAVTAAQAEALVTFTAIGPEIRVRGIEDTPTVARLNETHFIDAPFVTSADGTNRPDQVAVYGAEGIVGYFPPLGAARARGRQLIVKGFDRSTSFTTLAECEAYAQDRYSRLSFNQGFQFRVPSSAAVSPLAPVAFGDLIPGNLVTVELREQTIGFVAPVTMRIVAVAGTQGQSDSTARTPTGQFAKASQGDREFISVTLAAFESTS